MKGLFAFYQYLKIVRNPSEALREGGCFAQKGVINMNKEIEVKTNNVELKMVTPDQEKLIKGAVDLVNYFSGQGLMLPVTQEHYTFLASKGTLVVATDSFGDVVATAAYSQFYDDKKVIGGSIWEFGGWAVKEGYQKSKLGLKVANELFSKKTHYKTIAFGNKNSGPIFESWGAKLITDHSVLPKEVFIPCGSCPVKPASGCCDKIYNLEDVMSFYIQSPWPNNR